MESYISLVEDCDQFPEYPDTCYKFLIEGSTSVHGHLIESTVQSIIWNSDWAIDHNEKTVKLLGHSQEARQRGVDDLLMKEKECGTFRVLQKWTGERFPIFGPNREIILEIERSAARLFGAVKYGVQLIAYQEDSDGISVWVGRRAAHLTSFANMLGTTVGGSLPAGESPFECLIREAKEEASLDEHLIKAYAKAAGMVTYVTASESKTSSGGESGLIKPEVQYIYDMKVNKDFLPKPYDLEVSEFSLYSIDQLRKAIADGEFPPSSACFILDFFIRHGLVTFENEKNYNRIITRLHRPLGMQIA